MEQHDFSKARILTVCKSIEDYGEKALNAKDVRKAWKANKGKHIKYVNTPDGYPSLFFFCRTNNTSYEWFSYGILDDYEGNAYCYMAHNHDLNLLHSHAIRRYYQRHGFDGTYEECEKYVLQGLFLTFGDIDKITGEFLVYFDDGIFLGEKKDDIFHIKTYIKNTQCYQNQRLLSKNIEDMSKQCVDRMREYDGSNSVSSMLKYIDYFEKL